MYLILSFYWLDIIYIAQDFISYNDSSNFFCWIIIILAFIFEIFAMLVFNEIIELNFFGLNLNLKKNIIFIGKDEVYSIYYITEEDSMIELDTIL